MIWGTDEERESKKLWAERGFCRPERDGRVKWFPLWVDVYPLATRRVLIVAQ